METGNIDAMRMTRAWLQLLPLTLLVSACGGGGSGGNGDGGGGGGGSGPPAAILQVGMQRQYVGSSTRSVVYTNPTATTPNNTLAYSFTENQTVMQAPANVNADFDVQVEYTYTVTQDPGVGTVPMSQSVDNFENLLFSGDSQMIQTVAQNATVVSNDETSNALGGGPYTITTTTNSTYPSPRDSFSYPLQAGANMNVPQSAAQNITYTDVNASGAAPPNGTNIGYTRTRNENDDGSFSFQTADVNGNTLDMTENSDGSGSYTFTSTTATTTTTLGLPDLTAQPSTLPVSRSSVSASTGVTTTTTYTAADWYQNSGQANSPLVLQAETVVGPVSTLPAECNGAVLRPDIYEIDTTTTNQNTISPSYSVTTTRAFNADGVLICSLVQETSYAYALLTGELTSTTTTQTQTLLSAINY